MKPRVYKLRCLSCGDDLNLDRFKREELGNYYPLRTFLITHRNHSLLLEDTIINEKKLQKIFSFDDLSDADKLRLYTATNIVLDALCEMIPKNLVSNPNEPTENKTDLSS